MKSSVLQFKRPALVMHTVVICEVAVGNTLECHVAIIVFYTNILMYLASPLYETATHLK